MKFRWAVLLLLVVSAATRASHAQSTVAVYGEFSSSRFHDLLEDKYLNGGTVGVVFDAAKFKHLEIGGDLQGRFVAGASETYYVASLGPRLSLPVRFFHLVPYGEFLVGFARFSGDDLDAGYVGGNAANHTTDGEIQLNAGVTKQLTPRLDAVVDYSYSQFYAYGGQYNPKTFSGGAVYHFTKR